MPEKANRKNAILNITKALLGVSLTTLAAIGSASNNIWLAGLAALPAASLAASGTVGSQLSVLTAEEKTIEIPVPSWWQRDARSWQNLCDEIELHLPHSLQYMATLLQNEPGVVTQSVVQQYFVEAIIHERLTWAFEADVRRQAAETVVPLMMPAIEATLRPLIERKQREMLLLDTHSTTNSAQDIAANTQKMVEMLEKMYQADQTSTTPLLQGLSQQPQILAPSPSIVEAAVPPAPTTIRRSAVIVTALSLEYQAVYAHISNVRRLRHQRGTMYEQGLFATDNITWEVVLIEAGQGNTATAIITEQAIEYFQPDTILFVGIAGGIKDVKIGDVVVATKLYNYEQGKVEETYKSRPALFHTTYALEQQARAVLRQGRWLHRLPLPLPDKPPVTYIGPIAAGEKVIASTRSEIYALLRERFNDALAVEMEGYGFLHAAHLNRQVEAIVVRGISDLLDKKEETDKQLSQEIAAQNASAFAFEVLAQFY